MFSTYFGLAERFADDFLNRPTSCRQLGEQRKGAVRETCKRKHIALYKETFTKFTPCLYTSSLSCSYLCCYGNFSREDEERMVVGEQEETTVLALGR